MARTALVLTAVAIFWLVTAADLTAAARIEVSPLSVPRSDAAKRVVRASSQALICPEEDTAVASNGCVRSDIAYHKVARTGDSILCDELLLTRGRAGGPRRGGEGEACEEFFGSLRDESGALLDRMDRRTGARIAGVTETSSNPDFSSILQVGEDNLFLVVQFETPNPAAMQVMRLRQDSSGKLWPSDAHPVDWSKYGGLWHPCAGSRSPWQTHIGGEEYEPDAKYFSQEYYTGMLDMCQLPWFPSCMYEPFLHMRYFGVDAGYYPAEIGGNFTLIRERFNPYMYGYVFEVRVDANGVVENEKWFACGRRSNELAYVLPDRRSMYISDDSTNGMLNLFVADREEDFSSGTLYAARLNQTSDGSQGGTFEIEWIDLGHATSKEIEHAARTLTFADMFELGEPLRLNRGNETRFLCPKGFTAVNQGGAGAECLRVLPGMEVPASRLEARRYAALMGATTEFAKLEGMTFDADANAMYAAVSDLKHGMEKDREEGRPNNWYDEGGSDDIAVDYNKCGCVFTLDLDEKYFATKMHPLVCGTPKQEGANSCALDGISNPDNVVYMQEYETLIIAEDSYYHENNFVWLYHLPTKSLTRVLSLPRGAEATSPYWYEIGGYGFMLAVTQHPDGGNPGGDGGIVGYLGPFKLSNQV